MSKLKLTLIDKLELLEEIFLDGFRFPFTSRRLVSEADAIEVLQNLRDDIPREVNEALEILKKTDDYIKKSETKANNIMYDARERRDKMIDSYSVKQEAERQIKDLKYKTFQKCQEMIDAANKKRNTIEIDNSRRLKQLDEDYKIKHKEIEAIYLRKIKNIEVRAIEYTKQLNKENELHRVNLEKELTKSQNELTIIRENGQKELESIQREIFNMKAIAKEQCTKLINQTKQEAENIREGSYQYVDKQLTYLQEKVKKVNSSITNSKEEINSIRSKINKQKRNTEQLHD